jgi:hypothetical protein
MIGRKLPKILVRSADAGEEKTMISALLLARIAAAPHMMGPYDES